MTQPTVHQPAAPALPGAAAAADTAAPDPGRRQFLKAAPLGALAIAAGGARAAEATPAAAPAAPAPSGYHETEHIRRYYATAAYW